MAGVMRCLPFLLGLCLGPLVSDTASATTSTYRWWSTTRPSTTRSSGDRASTTTYRWWSTATPSTTDSPVSGYPWWYTSTTTGRQTTGTRTALRLVDGPRSNSGRVEVFYNGSWGTICDDSFDTDDAYVICRQLGYNYYRRPQFYSRAHYGQGNGSIIIDDLGCYGYEYDVSQCPSKQWLSHNCWHSEDVGVDCGISYRYSTATTRAYRYFSSTSPSYAWRYPSSTTRSRTTSGYPSMTSGTPTSGTRYPWWYTSTTSGTPTSGTRTALRLVGGPTSYSGRVEVLYHGSWGTICDDSFDADDARVICRQLGYNYGTRRVYPSAYFGQGSGRIVIDDLQCSGYEADVSQCRSSPWLSNNCNHGEDVGVSCDGYVYTSTSPPDIGTTYDSWAAGRTQYTTTGYPWWYTRTTTGTPSTGTWYRLEDAVRVSCDTAGWNIDVDLYRLRLLYPGARASDIYLGENSCPGQQSGWHIYFRHGLTSCLTGKIISGNYLQYRNELVYAMHDPQHPYIIRSYNWTVDVECDVSRDEHASGHLHHDVIPNQGHQANGSSVYAVNMTFYSDPGFSHRIPGNPLHVVVGTNVYAKVFTSAVDWSVKMKLHTCYTKPTPGSPEHLNYYLIKDGCEEDVNTHLISQSTHETRFVFQDFEYTTNHEGIYIYCDATLCDANDFSHQCLQTCSPTSGRKREATRPLATVSVVRHILHERHDDQP